MKSLYFLVFNADNINVNINNLKFNFFFWKVKYWILMYHSRLYIMCLNVYNFLLLRTNKLVFIIEYFLLDCHILLMPIEYE